MNKLALAFVILGVTALATVSRAQDPALAIDGALQFPDGSQQSSAFGQAPAPVPETGITRCRGVEWLCTGISEDAFLRAGVSWPEPRFTDNTDGTVTDNLTGLMWLKDAGCLGTGSWVDAAGQIGLLNGGTDFSCEDYGPSQFEDWRLPNVLELLSLIHWGMTGPALPNTSGLGQWSEGDPFSDVASAGYWSCTGTWAVWGVDLNDGTTVLDGEWLVKGIWAVRGG